MGRKARRGRPGPLLEARRYIRVVAKGVAKAGLAKGPGVLGTRDMLPVGWIGPRIGATLGGVEAMAGAAIGERRGHGPLNTTVNATIRMLRIKVPHYVLHSVVSSCALLCSVVLLCGLFCVTLCCCVAMLRVVCCYVVGVVLL